MVRAAGSSQVHRLAVSSDSYCKALEAKERHFAIQLKETFSFFLLFFSGTHKYEQ